MTSVLEFFWPCLECPKSDEKEKQKADQDKYIAKWQQSSDVVLAEAYRQNEEENERRKSAENKATIFLAVVGGLVPVLMSVAPLILEAKNIRVPVQLGGMLFLPAILYLLVAGCWSFRALKVGVAYRLDGKDLVEIWSKQSSKHSTILTRKLLIVTRKNRDPINTKVTYIKMAYEFLVRGFLALFLILGLHVAWKPVEWLVDATIAQIHFGG